MLDKTNQEKCAEEIAVILKKYGYVMNVTHTFNLMPDPELAKEEKK